MADLRGRVSQVPAPRPQLRVAAGLFFFLEGLWKFWGDPVGEGGAFSPLLEGFGVHGVLHHPLPSAPGTRKFKILKVNF